MRTFVVVLLGVLFAAGAQAPARAQTRLTVAVGGLVPFGTLDDRMDPSTRAAVRIEVQPVNAIGKISPLALTLDIAYSHLSLDPAVKDQLIAAGEDTNPYLLEIGAGARVYSRVAPFFLGAGAGYAHYLPGGAAHDRNGLDLHGGLGFLVPAGLVVLEADAAGHVVLLDQDDLQYLTVTLGVALPF